ncbi:MAG TPA: D-aminoacyl-tRNA deacylase [Bacteroidia bacterium]|nr:D-aminoacyl-tRNA deacylase [Bacteroidia bacterium]
MRAVIQRVSEASVKINAEIKSSLPVRQAGIQNGLLILLGIEDADGVEDIEWLCAKISNLRIFDDENGVMNLSVKEKNGDILLISQFTLHASTKKGNRPSYIKAAKPEIAIPLYEKFITQMEKEMNKKIYTGEFGADMKVALINNGPVTIIIDSKNKE